ncbi:MAG: 50S ribosomal protein L15 [Acidobacteria bacterium]|nr:MAG: 50S ribosomal protein L15 [Acidobacteriota bacterium]
MELHQLKPAKGATHRRKRIGRGPGSGHGKTATRGNKGQRSRSGHSLKLGFEGGQMPLHRRLPKRGFNNIFRREYAAINLSQLNVFKAGSTVTPEELVRKGIIKKVVHGVKILAEGNLNAALVVKAHKFSEAAAKKIQAVGGTVEVIGGASSR